jgi:hypothetical protein
VFDLATDCVKLNVQLRQTIVGQDIQWKKSARFCPSFSGARSGGIIRGSWKFSRRYGPGSRHSRPVAFEEGTLTLESDCTAWSAEMRRMADAIRAQVNQYLGVPMVRRLKVRYVSKPISTDAPLPDPLKVN